MEVKGEYGMASSTVGGGLYARPPALPLCHSPLVAMATCRIGQNRRGGGWRWRAASGRTMWNCPVRLARKSLWWQVQAHRRGRKCSRSLVVRISEMQAPVNAVKAESSSRGRSRPMRSQFWRV